MTLIEFRGVRKRFGSNVVFDGLDLDIERGESLTIIGSSGQGKSVLLKLLIGLLQPDAGTIRFDGLDLVGRTELDLAPIRRRIGMLFQGSALFDSMSVRENVAYGLREHLQLPEAEISHRVADALSEVGLEGAERLWPSALSGGMRKRVGLARAIALRPEALLYDEPTTGLDPINTTRINRLIVQLKEQLHVTSVVVTHDMQSAFAVSDRIVMIDRGKVVASGRPEDFRDSEIPAVRVFVDGAASLDTDTEPIPDREE